MQEWIEKLAPSGLLNLLRIPHFGRSPKLNAVVKVLLSCVHEGYLWLDRKIKLNVDVIHRIYGLSKVGRDQGVHLVGKSLDQKLATMIMKENNVTKGMRAYDSIDIQDQALQFMVQLLVGQVLRKCRPSEVPAREIDLVVQEKEGMQYNWCLYLLNHFMEDYKDM